MLICIIYRDLCRAEFEDSNFTDSPIDRNLVVFERVISTESVVFPAKTMMLEN
jgi:hypothetical protein